MKKLLLAILFLLPINHLVAEHYSDANNFNYDIYQDPKAYGKIYTNDIFRGKTLKNTFKFNTKETTTYGPAYANIAIPDGLVNCNTPIGRKFSYALCFYSGPAYKTGVNPRNPMLPCTLQDNGVIADCDCQLISSNGVDQGIPYGVGIDVISNLAIYEMNTEACGINGDKCNNDGVPPPVCDAINTNLLIPGADFISAYSTALQENYYTNGVSGTTNCETGLYAGCMTSPCYKTGRKDSNGQEIVSCKCPVYRGPFQIGQANQNCDANKSTPTSNHKKILSHTKNYVWSGKYPPPQ